MNSPLVSVVIPAFNVEKYIDVCLQSILSQTYSNLEVWLVDDASTDKTRVVAGQMKDSRLHILCNETNRGLAACVNSAIRQSNGRYIARMDGDDIAVPSRIQKQVEFLESNPKISIVGSAMQSFGYSRYLHRFPATHDGCKAQLLFNVCFGHPTVLARKELFDNPENLYREELQQYSEEYDLWCRLVDHHQFANLSEVLLQYRTFPPSLKGEAAQKRTQNSFVIRKNFIAAQFGEQLEQDYHCHDQICNLVQSDRGEVHTGIQWLKKIAQMNAKCRSFDEVALNATLANWYFEWLYANHHLGLQNFWNWYSTQNMFQGYSPSFTKLLKFFLRSCLRA